MSSNPTLEEALSSSTSTTTVMNQKKKKNFKKGSKNFCKCNKQIKGATSTLENNFSL